MESFSADGNNGANSLSDIGHSSTENAMKTLVPIINKLRDAFVVMKDSPIDLPLIAVVGSQSAGKSSVLENIVGHSFLPRGSGIVTRCPCEIRMHASAGEAYGMVTSSQDPDKKYYDFEEIRLKIESETQRVCGPRGLSTIPILLDIYSPDVVDLTLVDLPGAVRIAGEGQDPSVVRSIQAMILSYIERDNVIVLAVNAANTDLANSDALALSRQIDPEGERTLAVLTKLDLMDQGTHARDILTGHDESAPKLKLGYLGVVNRSQKDIIDSKSMAEARAKEAAFFQEHEAYRTLASSQGTEQLVKKCAALLVGAIQRKLPLIDAKVKELIGKKLDELKALPETTQETMRIHYQDIVREFETRFNGLLDGTSSVSGDYEDALHGGARIANLFEYSFQDAIMGLEVQGLESMDTGTYTRIRTMIKNRQGLGGGLYVPNNAFHTLVREQVGLTEAPCLECATDVLHEMRKVQRDATEAVKLLNAFPVAKAAISQKCNEILQEQHAECVKYLQTHVAMNQLRISYGHPDFHKDRILFEVEQKRYGTEDSEDDVALMVKARSGSELTKEERLRVRAITERRQRAELEDSRPRPGVGAGGGGGAASSLSASLPLSSAPPMSRALSSTSSKIHLAPAATSKEELEIEKLLALTRAYFQLVQKQVVDLVPKYIQLLLVEEPKTRITAAIGALTDRQVADLMAPAPEVTARRAETLAALEKLREAEKMIFDVARMENTSTMMGPPY